MPTRNAAAIYNRHPSTCHTLRLGQPRSKGLVSRGMGTAFLAKVCNSGRIAECTMVVNEYLYIFGYEDPGDRKSNMENGTDYESSRMIRILASTEQEALLWGDEIAERYVQSLFGDMKISWKAERFASWIENSPDAHLKKLWEKFPLVNYGEFPDFTKLEEAV